MKICNSRQHRTKLVRKVRSQIFRQIAQKFRRHTAVWQGISGQYDGFVRCCLKKIYQNPSTSFAGPPRTERSPLPCGHLPTPWGVTLFKGG